MEDGKDEWHGRAEGQSEADREGRREERGDGMRASPRKKEEKRRRTVTGNDIVRMEFQAASKM